jgi:hypothetical protein
MRIEKEEIGMKKIWLLRKDRKEKERRGREGN